MDISKLTGQVVGILVEHLSVVGFDITVHEVVHQIALGATCAPLCKTARIQRAVFLVRPAWAHSCGCKSRHKLITANEVKRNCMRATECGEEAWSVNREPMDKNCIEGTAEQGERARDREALVIKMRRRKCSGCAMKECVLTWGDLALCLKGRRC